MSRIHRLPVALANQIAAGEVVGAPRPSSRSSWENSLDAGARRITVTTEFGGKRLVRVEDDGEGMVAEDARLALERHATSKIRTSDDLAAIETLGFRGEALPSIASVSHLMLRTRARAQPREPRSESTAASSIRDRSRFARGHADRYRGPVLSTCRHAASS